MDIIQQKLIWFLGSGASLILLFKLNLGRAGLSRAVLTKFRLGLGFIFIGSILGIVLKIGLVTGSFSHSWQAYFAETVIGYVFGWSMIIIGAMGWVGAYFDKKGRPLATINERAIAEKVSASLIKGHRANQLLDSVISEINDIFHCQAVSLHKIEDDGGLRLAFESGLAPGSKELINSPIDDQHMFWTAKETGHAVISDKDLVFGDGARLHSESGPLKLAVSIPVKFENDILGILTLFRGQNLVFEVDDINLIEIVCDGLGIALDNDISERKYNLVSRYREMLIMAARPFENGEALVSALIKSAKLVHGYIPFKAITLYIHGDDRPYESDFNLSTGGLVAIKSGYFLESTYPELYESDSFSDEPGIRMKGISVSSDQRNYLFTIKGGNTLLAHLSLELSEPAAKSSYIPLLGAALGQRIAERLEADKVEKIKEKTEQWLGALEYYQSKGLTAGNLSVFLKELASLVVDLTPVTFCRIMFADPNREHLKTIGLAQVRELAWQDFDTSRISLPKTSLHYKALSENESTRFITDNGNEETLTADEIENLLPEGTKHGLIVPIHMGGKPVGLLTVGESRNSERASLRSGTELFVYSIARLVSMVLTWQQEKRILKETREGRRSLMLRKKEAAGKSSDYTIMPSFKTRLNGPLASILASCEYLQSQGHDEDTDVNRYLKIIQRNATKIHNIASGMAKNDQKVVG
ncbi:MAG: GAF domain-containing protein [candidate division Zixibacteria bacterium]